LLVLHVVHGHGQGGHVDRLHAHERRHLHLRRGLPSHGQRRERERELHAVRRRHLRCERRNELLELRD
jgi:hypothetical protein